MKVPTIGRALALLLACAVPAAGEELVAFSSSHEGPGAWQLDGVSLHATNGQLRFTLVRDGVGHASVLPHLPALPDGRVRLFARGAGVVRVAGGGVATNLVPAGWNAPADLLLPAGPAAWQVRVEVSGRAGATCEVRELLVTGRLDLEAPLLQASGRKPEHWLAEGGVAFTAAGVRVRGAVETRDTLVYTNRAVLVLRVAEVVGQGVVIRARALGAGGELLGDLELGVAARAGLQVIPLGPVAWPPGVRRVGIRVQAVAAESSAVVRELEVGQWPDA